MSGLPNDNAALHALKLFLQQMRDWEVKYSLLDEELEDSPSEWRAMRAEASQVRQHILQNLCAQKLLTDEVLNTSLLESPSRFDPDRDLITEIEGEGAGNSAVFEYQQTVGLRSKFRFTVTLLNGGWRIEKAELARSQIGVWESLIP